MVEVGHEQGHGVEADQLAGREHFAGEQLAKQGERRGRAAVSASSRGAIRSTRTRISRSCPFARASTCPPARRDLRQVGVGPSPEVEVPATGRSARLDPEVDRIRELRPSEPVRAGLQRQVEHHPLAGGDPRLRRDVRRVRRAARRSRCPRRSRGSRDGPGRSARPSWRSPARSRAGTTRNGRGRGARGACPSPAKESGRPGKGCPRGASRPRRSPPGSRRRRPASGSRPSRLARASGRIRATSCGRGQLQEIADPLDDQRVEPPRAQRVEPAVPGVAGARRRAARGPRTGRWSGRGRACRSGSRRSVGRPGRSTLPAPGADLDRRDRPAQDARGA